MVNCPRCKKPVDSQVVKCPNCNNILKAFGHPGMPLYQSEDGSILCDRCTYDHDDSCNFPKRPHAKSCTLFHDVAVPLVTKSTKPRSTKGLTGVENWLYQNRGIIAIALLILFSVIVTINN